VFYFRRSRTIIYLSFFLSFFLFSFFFPFLQFVSTGERMGCWCWWGGRSRVEGVLLDEMSG